MNEITQADRRVLELIQQGLDLTRQEMAEAAGMSASTFWRRVNDLEKSGVIRKRVTLLEPLLVGLSVCVFLSVNLKDHGDKTRRNFERLVGSTPEIMECFSVTGQFDYVMIIRTKGILEFEDLLMKRILGHPSVASASSQISLRQHKYTTELPL